MPWKETCAMDERLTFIAAHLKREYSVSELCRHFGISRPTAYKWIERYEQCGPEGFLERRRVPKHHPNETPAALQYKLIALRQRHPKWGPRKLLALLKRAEPEVSWPAVSTAGDILKRHGLTQARRYRRSTPSYDRPFYVASRPNDVWAADFKGWFKTGDGHRVDPLTISDWVSRYLLCCRGLERPIFEQVRPQFERAFREYGLPWAIRTDNGPPFASVGLGGLSRLSVWWIRLGIKPERIRPAHPEDNGRHERMHKTLKEPSRRRWISSGKNTMSSVPMRPWACKRLRSATSVRTESFRTVCRNWTMDRSLKSAGFAPMGRSSGRERRSS
jgi:putative transposase